MTSTTRTIRLVQIGFGTVGGALINQVLDHRNHWREIFGLDVVHVAVGSRHGAIVADDAAGLPADRLRAAVQRRQASGGGGGGGGHAFEPIVDVVQRLSGAGPVVVLDAAAGPETAAASAAALETGGAAVLCNKAPLALNTDDPVGATLWTHAGPGGRLRYEATCGAGLPVISTLRSLIDTGDDVIEITGALSGTFGAIFSSVADGASFSAAIRTARDQGYTEPDPRDDLSGLDVARKGLILARTLGASANLGDIAIQSLVPDALAEGTADEFLAGVAGMDADIAAQSAAASSSGTALKYVAHLDRERRITVGLRTVPTTTVLGAMQGPENIVSMRTARYDTYPCVVSGPGAGADVTAAGMVADLLAVSSLLD